MSRAARARARTRSARNVEKSLAAASGRILTTRSTPSVSRPVSFRAVLNISRVHRFRRFRRFALPSFLVAVMPNLGPLPSFGFPKTTTYRPKVFFPVRYVSRYSRRFRIRASFEKDPDRRFAAVMSDAAAGFPPPSGRQALAALAATAVDDCASRFRAHPDAEAVLLAAASVVWLKSPLHLIVLTRFIKCISTRRP